jgi:hypothetical protein
MLTLEDLGNLGEFVAAIGVVVSLVYLAFQVRDNSKFVKENSEFLRATHDVSSNDGVAQFRRNYFDHPELLDIERRGNRCEALDFTEAAQYQLLVSGNFENHFTYYLQYERGLTSEAVWNYWSSFFDSYCQNEGVIHWWRKSEHRFPNDFRDYIDDKVALHAV